MSAPDSKPGPDCATAAQGTPNGRPAPEGVQWARASGLTAPEDGWGEVVHWSGWRLVPADAPQVAPTPTAAAWPPWRQSAAPLPVSAPPAFLRKDHPPAAAPEAPWPDFLRCASTPLR